MGFRLAWPGVLQVRHEMLGHTYEYARVNTCVDMCQQLFSSGGLEQLNIVFLM